MAMLWFVRHGPTHAKTMTGWTDLPADLSDTSALARLERHLPAKAPVISSDLARAKQTAAAIAGGRPRLAEDPNLRELHFGAWEGLAFDAIPQQDLARKFWETPGDIAPPDGESWNALGERVSRTAEGLRRSGHPDVIVVCHMGPILTQLQRATGQTAHAVLSVRIDPLSVTRIEFGDTWHVHEVNHIP